MYVNNKYVVTKFMLLYTGNFVQIRVLVFWNSFSYSALLSKYFQKKCGTLRDFACHPCVGATENAMELPRNCSRTAPGLLWNFNLEKKGNKSSNSSAIALELHWDCSENAPEVLQSCSGTALVLQSRETGELKLRFFRKWSGIALELHWKCSGTAPEIRLEEFKNRNS